MSSTSTELSPEAQAYRQQQEAEYSAYVATEQIFIDGALAFNVGDPVPKGHVDRGVVSKDQVKKAPKPSEATATTSEPTKS